MRRFLLVPFLLAVFSLVPFPCFSTQTAPTEQSAESSVVTDDNTGLSSTEPEVPGWGLYFGLLHSHSSLSDGLETVEEVFRRAASVEGLDFFAVTDKSNSFDNADSGDIAADAAAVSQKWAAGKAAALAVTDSGFVGIFGYEMSWGNGLGHMGTFCTPGFQSWQQDAFSAYRTGLQAYYETLAALPDAIGQFNHPGMLFGDFQDFGFYSESYDRVITLLEVGSRDHPAAYEYYDRALEKGWHVAPTNNDADHNGRTVVYAHSLTEEGIYDALRNYRVYATEDCNLSIYYSMDGHFMGSRLKKRHIGDKADILVTLSDPTDSIGTVEVIGERGEAIASQEVEGNCATVEFSLDAAHRYYYLRVTQPDGDIAVTAPIWVESKEYAGVSGFTCATALPVQGQAVALDLELFNSETYALTVEQIDIFVDGTLVQTLQESRTLWQGGKETIPIRLTCDAVGVTQISVSVTASLGGASRSYSASQTLSFRLPDMVTSILVDQTHGNADSFAQLAALAVENNIAITVEKSAITAQMLENSSILVIPGPKTAFSEAFIALVQEYVSYGGSLIFCGGTAESNRLLEALGSTLRFGEDSGETQYLTDFYADSPWCANLQPGQLFYCSGGIHQGSGSWIVENALAVEETAFGGRIFAGSGAWLSEDALSEPKNIWELPGANRTILKNILGCAEAVLPLNSIADVRQGEAGQLFCIRGYITAGTANPYNTFENTIYLQDDTGGIAVVFFTDAGLSVGTPIEIVGYLARQEKNTVLELISYRVLDAALYRYLPLEGPFGELMDNSLHGGQLVQVEGKVVTFRYREDGSLRELVLENGGSFATVHIEDNIFSGATGRNDLTAQVEVGRRFRAIGIVHMRSDGISVVRVRNCDEVVYVPLITYYWEPCKPDNPRVGDTILLWMAGMLLSAGLLVVFQRRRIM